ncbi:hypothetical protein COLU111180_13710 [Cohnella lubricantis]|uniref:Uncharacterized protein n=1 Tax=Cohnella lubricantis TaxID=2163172 RepID=A0A841TFT5_9BACL|nr:hypothetical protein [Cohnella lubricantis]MBB6677807.1 hypothetical protein [Cohnella lubricantis]MBP2120476.1 hypothetical protein [Cohnella lubricantis]
MKKENAVALLNLIDNNLYEQPQNMQLLISILDSYFSKNLNSAIDLDEIINNFFGIEIGEVFSEILLNSEESTEIIRNGEFKTWNYLLNIIELYKHDYFRQYLHRERHPKSLIGLHIVNNGLRDSFIIHRADGKHFELLLEAPGYFSILNSILSNFEDYLSYNEDEIDLVISKLDTFQMQISRVINKLKEEGERDASNSSST